MPALRWVAAAAATIMLFAQSPAWADEPGEGGAVDVPSAQPDEPGEAERRAAGIEAITVTAQKRETLLQETPIAVSAFTSDDLETLTLRQSKNLADFSPGITMSRATSTPNQLALFGRGLGRIAEGLRRLGVESLGEQQAAAVEIRAPSLRQREHTKHQRIGNHDVAAQLDP